MTELGTGSMYDGVMDIILALNKEHTYDKLLDTFLTQLMGLTRADAGTLYLAKKGALQFHIVKNTTFAVNEIAGEGSDWPPIVLNEKFIDNASAYVAINKETVVIDDVYEDTRFNFTGPMDYDSLTGYKTISMLIVPLITNNGNSQELLGVIQLINAIDPIGGGVCSFTQVVDIDVINAFCNIATNILANRLHIEANRLLLDSMVDVTTQAIAERSAYSKNHSQNVASYCRAFATYLNEQTEAGETHFSQHIDPQEIAFAGLLHDIGKIITPLEIMDKANRLGEKIHEIRYRFTIKEYQLEIAVLKGQITDEAYALEMLKIDDALVLIEAVNEANSITDTQAQQVKELAHITYTLPRGGVMPILNEDELDALSIRFGTLTSKERLVMQNHVVITGRLLDKMIFPDNYRNASIWAKNHHELLDGTGYPAGLKGDEIDIGSRILTIVDIFDALISSDRPYKRGIPLDRSMEILGQMATDGKLDVELVKLFIQSEVWRTAQAEKLSKVLPIQG